jgi:hypothetical protein
MRANEPHTTTVCIALQDITKRAHARMKVSLPPMAVIVCTRPPQANRGIRVPIRSRRENTRAGTPAVDAADAPTFAPPGGHGFALTQQPTRSTQRNPKARSRAGTNARWG